MTNNNRFVISCKDPRSHNVYYSRKYLDDPRGYPWNLQPWAKGLKNAHMFSTHAEAEKIRRTLAVADGWRTITVEDAKHRNTLRKAGVKGWFRYPASYTPL
jgi:hypothetical protein